MKPPVRIPGLPEHHTLVGAGNPVMGLQAPTPALPDILGTRAVWLAPDACLVRSHLPPPATEPVVVQVVGVADYGDWAGAVLLLV